MQSSPTETVDESSIKVNQNTNSAIKDAVSTALSQFDLKEVLVPKKPNQSDVDKKSALSKHIKRPMNAFMVWAQAARRALSKTHPTLHNAQLSKTLGNMWHQLKDDQKVPFIEEANRLRDEHSKKNPGYKYQPKRRPKMAFLSQTIASAINSNMLQTSTLLNNATNNSNSLDINSKLKLKYKKVIGKMQNNEQIKDGSHKNLVTNFQTDNIKQENKEKHEKIDLKKIKINPQSQYAIKINKQPPPPVNPLKIQQYNHHHYHQQQQQQLQQHDSGRLAIQEQIQASYNSNINSNPNNDSLIKNSSGSIIPITEFKITNNNLSQNQNVSFQFSNDRIIYNFPSSSSSTSASVNGNGYSQLFQYQNHHNQYPSKHDLIEMANNNYLESSAGSNNAVSAVSNSYSDIISAKKFKSENSVNQNEEDDDDNENYNPINIQQIHQQQQNTENLENISSNDDLEDDEINDENDVDAEENQKSNIDMEDLDNISNVNDPNLAISTLDHGKTLSTSSSNRSSGSSDSPPMSHPYDSSSNNRAPFPNFNQYLSSCFVNHYNSNHQNGPLNYSNTHGFNNTNLNLLNTNGINESSSHFDRHHSYTSYQNQNHSHFNASDSLYQLPAAAFTVYKQSQQYIQNRQYDQQQQQQQQQQHGIANSNNQNESISNFMYQIPNIDSDSISNYKRSASNSPSLLINQHFDSEQKSYSRSQTNSPLDQTYLSSLNNSNNISISINKNNHLAGSGGSTGGSNSSPNMSLSTTSQSFASPQSVSSSSLSSTMSTYSENNTQNTNNQLKHSLNMFVPFNNYA